MSELMVVGFQGIHRAAEVLDQVIDLNAASDWTIGLKDAVAVYRTTNGRLRVDSSMQPTSKVSAVGGGLLGALIGGLLALPLTGGASAAVVAGAVGAGALTFGTTGALLAGEDAADMKARYGLSEDFVKQVGGMVQPGQSAVFLLGNSPQPKDVAERFRGYGGTILRTTLSPDAAAKLQALMTPVPASAH